MNTKRDTPEPTPHRGGKASIREFLNAEDVPSEQQLAVLRRIIDAVPDAIIVHDFNGNAVFFNDGACTLLGYSRDEMARLKPFGWVAPEAMSAGAGRLARILKHGHLRFESGALQRNGAVIPTDVHSRRLDTLEGPLVVAVIRDASERVANERELEFLAYHDALTGLSNRTAFEERLRVAIADTRRHGDILGLAYIDLDRFKPVNDRFGHNVGDSVLITIGSRLMTHVREQDLVARLGGDEFVILLPRMASTDEIKGLAERLLAAVREPIATGSISCTVDATIGFALFDHEVDDARALVVKADVAMYRAKRDPDHPWLEWTPEMGMSVSGPG